MNDRSSDWRDLPRLRWWLLLGRAALLLTVVVCLLPMPASPLTLEGGDKLGHAGGWLLITLWYAQLTSSRRSLLLKALGFVALGAAIELVQSLTSWRSGDVFDLLANAVGVAAGVAVGLTPAGTLLVRFDRRA